MSTSPQNPYEIPMIKDLIKQIQLLSPVFNGSGGYEAADESPEIDDFINNPECSEFKIVEFETSGQKAL